MRIKIISDGRPWGTKVVDADTGTELDGVAAVSWEVKTGHQATAVLRVIDVSVELEVEEPTIIHEPVNSNV